MTNYIYKKFKNKINQVNFNNLAVEIGIYDNNDEVFEEKLVPLGNYIYDPMPSKNEQDITRELTARKSKY